MNLDLMDRKNVPIILEIIKSKGKIRRGELYKEVKKKQEMKFGKPTTYQVIGRDIDHLKNRKIIRVVEGGPRSEVLSIN